MSADKSPNIQNDFFNRARKDGGPVTIYLTNGKKLTGRIRAFDGLSGEYLGLVKITQFKIRTGEKRVDGNAGDPVHRPPTHRSVQGHAR